MQVDESIEHKIQRVLELKRALHLVWESSPGWTIASIVLLVVEGTLPLLALYLMKLIIDEVATSLATSSQEIAFGQVSLLIGLTGTVFLATAVSRSIMKLVTEAQTQVVVDHVYDTIHAKSIEVDLEYYENSQYYDTLHRAQQEAPFRPIRIVSSLIQVCRSGISLLVIAGMLISFHWAFALILFASAIPGFLMRLRYSDKLYRWRRRRTSTERRATYFNWMLTRDTYAKEIRLFGLGPLFKEKFRGIRAQLRSERLEIMRKRFTSEVVAEASMILVMFGSYIFIAYQTIQGVISLGDLVLYYEAFRRGQGFFQGMMWGLVSLYEDSLFVSDLHEFLNLKPKVVEPLQPMPVSRPMQIGIAFDGVGFQYPNTNRKALEGITLTIRPGETVALVGENGSGKTTLIKLLCRLYDPTEGNIIFDGTNLRQFETTALRHEISVVFQDYVHYYLTARENIWFGNIDLPIDHKQIRLAAQNSGVDEVISGLKNGYDTVLGKWFEDGEELSIGEWQKVSLARTFLRDAQIIVLDEPTSALDAEAEYEIFKKFHELTAGRTAILISHRLSTVRMADRIYVLHNGRIIENGTHNELICRNGKYTHLFQLQAQHYG